MDVPTHCVILTAIAIATFHDLPCVVPHPPCHPDEDQDLRWMRILILNPKKNYFFRQV